MDAEAQRSLADLDLSRVTLTSLSVLEKSNPALLATKPQRSRVEYYYTCGPSFLIYVLQQNPEIDLVTYLDADLRFFSNPEPIFSELADSSVGIISHRFPIGKESLNRFGTFNVGWVSFRADGEGLECLRWWADRCIEWCYDRVETDRFADQKYLDQFAQRFQGVRVIQHPGANLAPWNLARHAVTDCENKIQVDGQPLIFFHFHGFKMLKPWLFDTNMGEYRGRPSKMVREKIFGPYIHELTELQRNTSPSGSLMDSSRAESRGYGRLFNAARQGARVVLGIWRNAYIIEWDLMDWNTQSS